MVEQFNFECCCKYLLFFMIKYQFYYKTKQKFNKLYTYNVVGDGFLCSFD